MDLALRFTLAQIEVIMEEAAIYMCACPAQVSREILNLRKLYRYQQECVAGSGDPHVHGLIATQVAIAHGGLEECLAAILEYENWDPITLKMPADLRRLRDDLIKAE